MTRKSTQTTTRATSVFGVYHLVAGFFGALTAFGLEFFIEQLAGDDSSVPRYLPFLTSLVYRSWGALLDVQEEPAEGAIEFAGFFAALSGAFVWASMEDIHEDQLSNTQGLSVLKIAFYLQAAIAIPYGCCLSSAPNAFMNSQNCGNPAWISNRAKLGALQFSAGVLSFWEWASCLPAFRPFNRKLKSVMESPWSFTFVP